MNKDNYHEQGNIIIMLLLLPLGHISNNHVLLRRHGGRKGREEAEFGGRNGEERETVGGSGRKQTLELSVNCQFAALCYAVSGSPLIFFARDISVTGTQVS